MGGVGGLLVGAGGTGLPEPARLVLLPRAPTARRPVPPSHRRHKKKENGSQDYHGGLQSTSTIPWKPEPRKMAGRNNEGRTWAALLRQTDAVADVVEGGEVDGPADVLDGPFGIGRRQNLVLARRRLVGRQHADLAPRHLLLVDHHLRDRVHRFDSSFSVRLSVFFGMAKFFYAFQQLIYAS